MKNHALLLGSMLTLVFSSNISRAQSGMIEAYGGVSTMNGTTLLNDFFADHEGSNLTMSTGFIWSQFEDGRDASWEWMLDVSMNHSVTSYRDYAIFKINQFVPDSIYVADYRYFNQSIRFGVGGQITKRLNRNITNGEWAFTLPILASFDLGFRQAKGMYPGEMAFTKSDFGMDKVNYGLSLAPGIRFSKPLSNNRYKRFSIGIDFPSTFYLVSEANSGSGAMAFQYGIPYGRLRLGWIF